MSKAAGRSLTTLGAAWALCFSGVVAAQSVAELSTEERLRRLRKLPRQAHRLNLDSRLVVDLGKNWVGGTRPRLSLGRSSLYSRSQVSTISRT
jgi:hypothetical protein